MRINELIQYSSVTAKARAMYGRMLTGEDWQRLAEAGGLPTVWETVRRCGAWAIAGEDPLCAQDGDRFAAALARQLEEDARRLCLYLKAPDRETLSFFLRRPDGSMTPEEARRWWREGGAKNAGLRRIAGAEADALNLVYLLRLRGFPASAARAEELLIPVRDKLTPELVRRLMKAPDDWTVLNILKTTPWGGVFTSLAPGELEKQYSAHLAAFCRRVLASAEPGLTAPQAFLTLKEMERQRLTRLVEASSRGIDPRRVI